MKKNRREFLSNSLALGLAPMLIDSPFRQFAMTEKSKKSLKILILGGTSFLGPHQIAYALERGHQVSIFTRGKTVPKIHTKLFDKVEKLVGDRENNLESLKKRTWDVVIDNSGRKTKWTEETAKLLVDNVDLYLYTSSISVYFPFHGADFSEKRKLVTIMPKNADPSDIPTYEYGIMKANSEIATINSFGINRSIIVRPTLIVGPGDRTDRFPYWLTRIEKGGDVIIPGSRNEVVQYIDVRDLAEWMIRLLENKITGTFNGSGPGFSMTTNAFVHGIHASFNSPINYIQIDDINFLRKNQLTGIQPWVIQLPKYEGMSKTENNKAIAAGLNFRPLSETVQATRKWWYSNAVSDDRRSNILYGTKSFMNKEQGIISQWNDFKK